MGSSSKVLAYVFFDDSHTYPGQDFGRLDMNCIALGYWETPSSIFRGGIRNMHTETDNDSVQDYSTWILGLRGGGIVFPLWTYQWTIDSMCLVEVV
jgi:hypothetical protein